MTNNEIKKGASENTCEKIKAIYPHITVSGDVDNPYYSIDWYDIEKQEMYRGYSSYKLPLVRKWLQENFEVVEADIDDLINRQKAEIEALIAGQETLQKNLAKSLKVEAYKEIAESVKIKTLAMVHSPGILTTADYIKCIDDIVKEWVGENND